MLLDTLAFLWIYHNFTKVISGRAIWNVCLFIERSQLS